MASSKEKRRYSEKELEQIMSKVKPRPIDEREVRLEKLENSMEVAFLAIKELKAELNRIYSIAGGTQSSLEIEGAPPTKTRKISREEAVQIIKDYISKNPGCRTSEIISDLQIDPRVALDTLRDLKKRGKVRSERIA